MKLGIYLMALVACYVGFFLCVLLSFGSLPAQVATHFDFMGRPNGWMSREGFVESMIALGVLAPAFVVGLMASTGFIPVSFVNLPNRDFWLAPERRRATSAILLRFSLLFACLMVLFFTGLYGLVVQTNTSAAGQHLNNARLWFLVGLFVAGTAYWTFSLRRRFAYRP